MPATMAPTASSSTSTRRPTIINRQNPNSSRAPSPLESISQGSRRVSAVYSAREDEGLVMREKTDKDDGSVGKAGAVGVGVTRPKRRLSR